jgi:hypothetical protein
VAPGPHWPRIDQRCYQIATKPRVPDWPLACLLSMNGSAADLQWSAGRGARVRQAALAVLGRRVDAATRFPFRSLHLSCRKVVTPTPARSGGTDCGRLASAPKDFSYSVSSAPSEGSRCRYLARWRGVGLTPFTREWTRREGCWHTGQGASGPQHSPPGGPGRRQAGCGGRGCRGRGKTGQQPRLGLPEGTGIAKPGHPIGSDHRECGRTPFARRLPGASGLLSRLGRKYFDAVRWASARGDPLAASHPPGTFGTKHSMGNGCRASQSASGFLRAFTRWSAVRGTLRSRGCPWRRRAAGRCPGRCSARTPARAPRRPNAGGMPGNPR